MSRASTMKAQVPDQLALFAEPPRVPVAVRAFVPVVPPAPKNAPKRIDWFRVITTVLRSGEYSIQGAADEIGVARTTLIGWKQGAEPRYSEGERLVLLWCKITGESRDKLPMCAAWDYHFKP